MNLYSIALFLHFVAIMGGVSASTLSHLALFRVERATTAAEARQWLGLGGRASKAFPAVLLTFVATGGYMASNRWGWGASFVSIGMLAIGILLVNGILMGRRSRALGMALPAQAGDEPIPSPVRARIHDPVISTLPWVNTFVVLGAVLVMAAKPAIGPALAVMAVSVAVGLLVARRLSPRPELSSERSRIAA